MTWKKEDMSVPNLNVQCGQFQYKVPGTSTFIHLHWNIVLNSTSTTEFLESVDLLSSVDVREDPMNNNAKCGKPNKDLMIISKDRNEILSIVEEILVKDMQSKKMYYFFDVKKIENSTEFMTPCGIAEVYHLKPEIKFDEYQLINGSEDNKIKVIKLIKSGENKFNFSLVKDDPKSFYKGEKVLIKKMLYHNGKAEIKDENGIEASESFIVTGYEILEISYKSLSRGRNYNDVKEVVFFGPVDKDIELERHLINITAADVPYQLNCSYTKLDYAYLYEVKADDEVMEVKKLATDGAVVGNFSRSGDLVLYKPVDVYKMDWVCIYKTPNGKVTVASRLYHFVVMEKRKKYPNIFILWNDVNTQSIKKFSKIVTDESYIPSKVRDIKLIKHVDSDDEIVDYVTNLFDDTLIGCFKEIDRQIKAYYIQDVSPKRKYIISEGPRKETTMNFFKMLYLEDVRVVVAILYRDSNDQKKTKKDICYWPNEAVMFGSLNIEPIDLPDTKGTSNLEFSFRMKLGNESWKNLTIIHVPDWREFELPSLNLSLIELYKRINDCAGSENVLIHSSQAVGPRVFLVTYFACIFEAMIENKTLSNPMVILKMVREKCLGGQVTPREFGFMICSVLKHFINCAYLVDKESVQLKFANNIDNFIYHTRIVEADESNTFAQMMKFFAATNRGKMLDIIKQSQTVQMFDLDTLKAKCTRHLAVLKNRGMNKIRYPGVFCLDDAAVCIWGRPKNDLNSFIHANEMSYEIRNGKRRKLIMCQAPIPDTFDDMLDMIYRYRVGIIVLLVNPQERNGHAPKWSPYFPVENDQISTRFYIVNKISEKPVDMYNISETNYAVAIKGNTNCYNCFKIYHYVAWPDKSRFIEFFY
uniref:Spheroidin n=1 Tax=Parastrongyloides trichosuri TaxID=131310 RepID=A0A0N4ZJI3_PARTI